jgi:hypothetical protein
MLPEACVARRPRATSLVLSTSSGIAIGSPDIEGPDHRGHPRFAATVTTMTSTSTRDSDPDAASGFPYVVTTSDRDGYPVRVRHHRRVTHITNADVA